MKKNLLLFGFCFLFAGRIFGYLFFGNYTVPELKEKISKLPESGRESTKAMLLTELGIGLYREGKLDEAIQVLVEAEGLSPRAGVCRQLYRYLGKCYESSGRLDKAIGAYESSVKYDRKNWKRHRDLARLYRQAKLYWKAEESYSIAAKLNPDKAELFFALGKTWADLGFYSYAEENLIKALELGHGHREVFFELSGVFEGMGRYSEAAGSWKEVISDSSPDPDWARLIYLAVLAGDKDLAEMGLNKLISRDAPKETIEFYGDLVRLISTDPHRVLEKKGLTPALKGFLTRLE